MKRFGVAGRSLLLVIGLFASASPAWAMQIFIKKPTGATLTLEVEPNDTLSQIKATIEDVEGIASDQQWLVFDGKELADDQTLADYSIRSDSILLLIIRSRGNIDNSRKYAWAETTGWQNFNSANNSTGVQVSADHLAGYVWAENLGWIRLGSFSGSGAHHYANTSNADYGINRSGSILSGYAWSETAGWINFAPTHGGVTLNATTGQFDGYAWGENLGWIHLRNAASTYGVAVQTWTVTPSAGSGGSVNPNTAQIVPDGGTTSLTVTPNGGYSTNAPVEGGCPAGSWNGTTWTTGTINVDCTVSFSFTGGGGGGGGGYTPPPIDPPVTPPIDPPVTPPIDPPVTPPIDPPVTPPIDPPVTPPIDDNDGIDSSIEAQVPPRPNETGLLIAGDGNGDGRADTLQPNVTSLPFLHTSIPSANPDAPPVYVTLAAGGVNDSGVRLTNVTQIDAPPELENDPLAPDLPLGLISFTAELPTGTTSQEFELFVPPGIEINGYWKQTSGGGWANLASAEYGGSVITNESGTQLNFTVVDGGPFDNDGVENGSINDPSGPGWREIITCPDQANTPNRNTRWKLAELYIATFNRAPDVEGLNYWQRAIELELGWDITSVAMSFFDQPIAQQLYPELFEDDIFLIDALYQNLFGRAPDTAGHVYWRGELLRGNIQRGQLITALIEGAWANSEAANEQLRLADQTRIALAFADAQQERGLMYRAMSSANQAALLNAASEVLNGVDGTCDHYQAALLQIPILLDPLE